MTHYRRFDGDASDNRTEVPGDGSFAAGSRAEQIIYNQPLSLTFRVVLSLYGLLLFAVCAVVVVNVFQAEQRQASSEQRILTLIEDRTESRKVAIAEQQKQIDEQNVRTRTAVCAFLDAADPQTPPVINLGSAFGCPGYPIPPIPRVPTPPAPPAP